MRKILIVDDDAHARMTLKRLLTNERTIFQEAENGAQALEIAQRDPPDIILLDVIMPVLDGIETVSLLRKDPATRQIPVIIVTTVKDRECLRNLAANGVNGYMLKPVDGRVVRSKVAEVLSATPKKTQPSNANRLTVLAAHRNARARAVIEETLTPIGFHFSEAQTGPGALDTFRCEHPTLAYLDEELPFCDAVETARRVQAAGTAEGDSHTTFILMTSSRDREVTPELQVLGFRAAITWPCGSEDVMLAIDRAYGDRGFFPLYYSGIPVLHVTAFSRGGQIRPETLAKRIITATRGFLARGFSGAVVNFTACESAGPHAVDLMGLLDGAASGTEFASLHAVIDAAHAPRLVPAGVAPHQIHETLAEAVRALAE